jgi:GTP cyclohydrolase I
MSPLEHRGMDAETFADEATLEDDLDVLRAKLEEEGQLEGHDAGRLAAILLLQYVGEDLTREGLRETPERWLHALTSEWCRGYSEDPGAVLKAFEDGADGYDEMVVVRRAPFWSTCEHHVAPFFGEATIAYVPDGKVVGLSKLVRLLDVFARRLQVQERITVQVADALQEHLAPRGVGVILTARHLCMETRGVRRPGTETVTSALRGCMKDDPTARGELLALAGITG